MNDEQVVSDYEQLKQFLETFIQKEYVEELGWWRPYIGELSLQDLKKLRELSQFAAIEKLIEYSPVMFGDFVKIDKEFK